MKQIIAIYICLMLGIGTVVAQDTTEFRKKYVNHTEFGGIFGRVKYGGGNGSAEAIERKLNVTAQMYQGVQLTKALSTGVTIGMDWYNTALINPIAVGARYDITRGKNARLYATADAGYGFAWFHDDPQDFETKGGLMVNPGIGIRYGKPGGSAFTIGLSWKRQEVDVTKPPLWAQTERREERVYNRLTIKIGMSF
jgi:hypothetical protein